MKTCSSPIALTMGEPAGISAEITLKAWRDHRDRLQPFFVIDDPERIREISLSLGWKIDIAVIDKPDETFNYFSKCLGFNIVFGKYTVSRIPLFRNTAFKLIRFQNSIV